MDNLKRLIDFLNKLESVKLVYQLAKYRDSILVEVYVPGQHWEIEYMYDGTVQVEIYKSTGSISNDSMLEDLFKDFS